MADTRLDTNALKRRRLLQIMGASAATFGCTTTREVFGLTEPEGPPDVPMTLKMRVDYGRRLATRGRLNGAGPYDFIIDTAASITAVFQNLADRTAVTPSGGPDISVLGLSGVRTFPTFEIGDLTFGALALKNHISPILPDWPNVQRAPQGILGVDFFEDTITVFNPWGDTFDIWPAGSAKAQSILSYWARAPLKLSDFGDGVDRLYVVDIALNDHVFPFLLDTGSSVTVCNPEVAGSLRVIAQQSPWRPKRADVSDVHGDTIETDILIVPRVKIGAAELRDKTLHVSNAPFFDHVGFGDRPFGILGLDFLRAQRFAIDFRRNALFLDMR